MAGGGHVWQRGACTVKGAMHGEGGVNGKGGGMHGEGGMHVCRGAGVAGETATAVDGTHPTGMHSCVTNFKSKNTKLTSRQ